MTGVLQRGHFFREPSSSTPQFTQYDISILSEGRPQTGLYVRLLSTVTWMPSATSLRKKYRSTSDSMMLLAKFTVRISSKLIMAQLVRGGKGLAHIDVKALYMRRHFLRNLEGSHIGQSGRGIFILNNGCKTVLPQSP